MGGKDCCNVEGYESLDFFFCARGHVPWLQLTETQRLEINSYHLQRMPRPLLLGASSGTRPFENQYPNGMSCSLIADIVPLSRVQGDKGRRNSNHSQVRSICVAWSCVWLF